MLGEFQRDPLVQPLHADDEGDAPGDGVAGEFDHCPPFGIAQREEFAGESRHDQAVHAGCQAVFDLIREALPVDRAVFIKGRLQDLIDAG